MALTFVGKPSVLTILQALKGYVFAGVLVTPLYSFYGLKRTKNGSVTDIQDSLCLYISSRIFF